MAWTARREAIPVGPRAPAASDPSVEFSAPAIENGQVELAQAAGSTRMSISAILPCATQFRLVADSVS
jgi:hypothetical protein